MSAQRLARFRRGLQHHDSFVGEQRWAQQFGQLGGGHLSRTQPIYRDVVGAGLLARLPKDRRDRTLDQQLFVPQHQM